MMMMMIMMLVTMVIVSSDGRKMNALNLRAGALVPRLLSHALSLRPLRWVGQELEGRLRVLQRDHCCPRCPAPLSVPIARARAAARSRLPR
jgi:hypothetical protein